VNAELAGTSEAMCMIEDTFLNQIYIYISDETSYSCILTKKAVLSNEYRYEKKDKLDF
jgi:hypothetical protein